MEKGELTVTLCGSLMFKKEFEKIKEKLETLGLVVYTPQFFKEDVERVLVNARYFRKKLTRWRHLCYSRY